MLEYFKNHDLSSVQPLISNNLSQPRTEKAQKHSVHQSEFSLLTDHCVISDHCVICKCNTYTTLCIYLDVIQPGICCDLSASSFHNRLSKHEATPGWGGAVCVSWEGLFESHQICLVDVTCVVKSQLLIKWWDKNSIKTWAFSPNVSYNKKRSLIGICSVLSCQMSAKKMCY